MPVMAHPAQSRNGKEIVLVGDGAREDLQRLFEHGLGAVEVAEIRAVHANVQARLLHVEVILGTGALESSEHFDLESQSTRDITESALGAGQVAPRLQQLWMVVG